MGDRGDASSTNSEHLSVTVKAANQNLADLTVECLPDWSGKDLKKHLWEHHDLHPVSPAMSILHSVVLQ